MKTRKKEYIPYQKCPICNGDGIITTKVETNNSTSGFTIKQNVCHVCNGKGIIPMYTKE